jgi:hypothetical protein
LISNLEIFLMFFQSNIHYYTSVSSSWIKSYEYVDTKEYLDETIFYILPLVYDNGIHYLL